MSMSSSFPGRSASRSTINSFTFFGGTASAGGLMRHKNINALKKLGANSVQTNSRVIEAPSISVM